jgi:acetyl/propionyl-CoA carboxylase alpha subunit
MRGHAVEARLYAEDPTRAWQPSAGHVRRFEVPELAGIRVDSGVESGSEVTSYYDSMLAKVIAYAPTRDEAARLLAAALQGARVHGVTTNRDLLVHILRHDDFLTGGIDTGFLDRHDLAVLGAPLATAATECLHAVAAALAAQAERRFRAPVLARLPSGWRNNPSVPQRCTYAGRDGHIDVAYQFDRAGRCAFVAVNGAPCVDLSVVSCEPDTVLLSVDGVTRRYDVERAAGTTWVDGVDGSSVLITVERFPLPGAQLAEGALTAPLPGTVVKVAVAVGDQVVAGDTLVAIEAMKMEHDVRAPSAGTVTEVHVASGEQVDAGRLLVVVVRAEDRK